MEITLLVMKLVYKRTFNMELSLGCSCLNVELSTKGDEDLEQPYFAMMRTKLEMEIFPPRFGTIRASWVGLPAPSVLLLLLTPRHHGASCVKSNLQREFLKNTSTNKQVNWVCFPHENPHRTLLQWILWQTLRYLLWTAVTDLMLFFLFQQVLIYLFLCYQARFSIHNSS